MKISSSVSYSLIGIAAVGAAAFPGWASASTFAERCPDLPTCTKAVSEVLGQKYVFDSDLLKGKVVATPNLPLTRENAELVFTNMLHQQGYSRVPVGEPGVYQILRQRDARDLTLPLVTATEKQAPDLPNTWDLVTLSYKATHPEVVEEIARTARSFMPASARIIPSELGGTLLATDSAANLKKLYAIMKDLDRKPTEEMKRRWAEEEKLRRQDRQRRMQEEHRAPGMGGPGGPGGPGPQGGRTGARGGPGAPAGPGGH